MPSTYEVTHSADVPHREGEVQLVSQKPGTSIEPQALTRLLGVLNLDYGRRPLIAWTGSILLLLQT
jgi:hypothetical protein